jgi:hypothetical protein
MAVLDRRSLPSRLTKGTRATVALVVVSLCFAAAPVASAATGNPASYSGRVTTVTGQVPAGARVTAKVAKTPRAYTAAELALLSSRMYDSNTPPTGKTAGAPHHKPFGPALRSPAAINPNLTVLRNSTIPASGISGGTGYSSYVQEPSTDANGANIFQTGNWYATRSTDSGSTWSYLDPFSLFGSGFCCDQVTQYDPATGHQFWLLQFSDHLVIANASASGSGAFTGWCSWNITPSWFGLASTTGLDFNDMTISNTFVNISTNFFPSGGGQGAAVIRLPKQQMSTCSGFNYNYLNRTDSFTFKLVPGSTDTLYWGSNWGQINGSSFRVYAWPENSGNYSWWDRTVASYSFFTRNSGQNCASSDGVVTNWCAYADSRVLGAFRAGGVLGFSFGAKQDSSHPFPYSRVVWFRESDKSYLGAGDQWATWGAILFLSMAPNSAGQVGQQFTWGGGTGTTHYYPGAAVVSTTNNSINTSPTYYLWGGGNTCAYAGITRWGDYLTVRTYQANTSQWIASGYAIEGGDCGSANAYSEPHNVLFSG